MIIVEDRVVHLSKDRAEKLDALVTETGDSQDAVIEKALDLLYTLSGSDDRRIWAAMSQPSLAQVWDNADDAVYDDWKKLYDVP